MKSIRIKFRGALGIHIFDKPSSCRDLYFCHCFHLFVRVVFSSIHLIYIHEMRESVVEIALWIISFPSLHLTISKLTQRD